MARKIEVKVSETKEGDWVAYVDHGIGHPMTRGTAAPTREEALVELFAMALLCGHWRPGFYDTTTGKLWID